MTGCEDCLAALLDHDAFVLCRDFKGRTPIHFASACGHLEILRTLLQAALSTDPLDSVVDYSGYSPMHWASYSGKDLGWAPAHLCSALLWLLVGRREPGYPSVPHSQPRSEFSLVEGTAQLCEGSREFFSPCKAP